MGKEENKLFDQFNSISKANEISDDLKNIMLICNPTPSKG